MSLKVLVVVGARLNSSRLPGKHLLELAGKPLIARIFERLDRVSHPLQTVLATTADPFNQPLVDWCRANQREVYAHPGDVNDLVGRVDAVFQQHEPDVLVYICGDCPLLEPSFIDRVLKLLEGDPDFVSVTPKDGRRVIHQGIDIYPKPLWRRTVVASTSAAQREHVGAARVQFLHTLTPKNLEEPAIFYQSQQRISVDTPSDYRFMSTVYQRWYSLFEADTIVSLPWVIRLLAEEPALAALNADVHQKTVHEFSDAFLLVGACGKRVGLGHLRRLTSLARALTDGHAAGVRLLLLGESAPLPELQLIPHQFHQHPATGLAEMVAQKQPRAVVFDVPRRLIDESLHPVLKTLLAKGIALVNIDFSLPWPDLCERNHVPCFYLDPQRSGKGAFDYGWDAYLLEPAPPRRQHQQRLLVLTGGADSLALGNDWPALLAAKLPPEWEVTWVQGPFAEPPRIPPDPPQRWRVLRAPEDMAALMAEHGYALVVYGVSLFECLAQGMATVALAPQQLVGDGELAAFKQATLAEVSRDRTGAIQLLVDTLRKPAKAQAMGYKAQATLDGSGPRRLAQRLTAKKKRPVEEPPLR